MLRLFIAIPLPAELRSALCRLQQDLGRELPMTIRWTRPESTHLTLCFLGAIPEDSLEKLGTLVLSVGAGFSPFSVAVGGVGAFPSARQPKVLWCGVEGGAPLLQLAGQLHTTLRANGFNVETRPFVPHLTLGRLNDRPRDLTPQLARYRQFAMGRLPVEQLVLYRSRLLPSGAVHTPLVSAVLEPPATNT